MRWMRGVTLAAVGMLAGCLEAKTVHCADGVVCPEGMACALAPVYCESPQRVAACAGADDFTTCTADAVAGACRGGACVPCTDTNELAGCDHTGWFAMPSGTTANLRGVWTTGPGEAYAVGDDTILRYDGFRWAPEVIDGVVPAFTGVWGSDSDRVFASTGAGGIYQRAVDGTWGLVHSTGGQLRSIAGSGPDDVIALGSLGTMVRSATNGWAMETITTTDLLYGVAARSRDDVFVVGTRGVIHRSTGTTWGLSRPAAMGQSTLFAVAATPTTAFAIGEDDGTTTALRLPTGAAGWIKDPLPGVPAGATFTGIWAADPGAIAVGKSGRILHYTGTWAVVPSSTGTDLSAVHGSDLRNVFAVGAGGTIVRYTGP